MIKIVIPMLLLASSALAIDVPPPPKEKQSHTMDILDQAGRECRAMGPLACHAFIAKPAEKPKDAK